MYYIDLQFYMSSMQSSFEAVYLSLSFHGLCMFFCIFVFLILELQSALCAQCKARFSCSSIAGCRSLMSVLEFPNLFLFLS